MGTKQRSARLARTRARPPVLRQSATSVLGTQHTASPDGSTPAWRAHTGTRVIADAQARPPRPCWRSAAAPRAARRRCTAPGHIAREGGSRGPCRGAPRPQPGLLPGSAGRPQRCREGGGRHGRLGLGNRAASSARRTVTASRKACGRPASSSARKQSGSWWIRSVMTDAASANRPPPKQAPRWKMTRRQPYSSAWSSSCARARPPGSTRAAACSRGRACAGSDERARHSASWNRAAEHRVHASLQVQPAHVGSAGTGAALRRPWTRVPTI